MNGKDILDKFDFSTFNPSLLGAMTSSEGAGGGSSSSTPRACGGPTNVLSTLQWDRNGATQVIVEAKLKKELTWEGIAKELGRSPVWVSKQVKV
jgi:hypothetical protein